MSADPDVNGILSLGQPAGGAEAQLRAPYAVATPLAALPVFEAASAYELPAPLQAPPWEAQAAAPSVASQPPARRRPGWIVPAAIAIVGLIATGALGGLLYTTTGQRDVAKRQVASTQATLTSTDQQLAARKAVDAYLTLYVVNSGRVMTEYQNVVACDTYIVCRTAAQDALTNLKAFQAARSSAAVPSALANSDSQVGDALSAAIAADQEFITGMDTNDTAKIKEGFKKFNSAMLGFAKAETALAANLG